MASVKWAGPAFLSIVLAACEPLGTTVEPTTAPPQQPALSATEVARIGIDGTFQVERAWNEPSANCPVSFGSGAYLGKQMVLTAAHVIFSDQDKDCGTDNPVDRLSRNFRDATILVRGSPGAGPYRLFGFQAQVLKFDGTKDLALLLVPEISAESRALKWGESGSLHVGDRLVAIGYPTTGLTVTSGIVAALKSNGVNDLIQTDAAVNQGNSGGPLLNERGELVGIVDFRGGSGLNFAIASSTARPWVESH